jgi:hypothetical protein
MPITTKITGSEGSTAAAGDEQQQRGEREGHVGGAHHQSVRPPPVVPRHEPEQHAERQRDRLAREADHERDARAVQGARQEIPALRVGAEEMRDRRGPQAVRERAPVGIRRGEEGRERRHDDERRDEREAEPGPGVRGEPVTDVWRSHRRRHYVTRNSDHRASGPVRC